MLKSIVAAGFVTVVVSLSTIAEAKVKKPVVCFAFSEQSMVVDGASQKVAICQDGAKPVILTTYQVMTVKDGEGAPVKAAIGYR